MKNELMRHEILIYSLITVSCIIAVALLMLSDINPQKSYFEMYLQDYPDAMQEGQNISFSVMLIANQSDSPLLISIYFDGALQKSIRTTGAEGKTMLKFDMENAFKSGDTHEITVKAYDEAQPYTKYGSGAYPYYIFFRVDIE